MRDFFTGYSLWFDQFKLVSAWQGLTELYQGVGYFQIKVFRIWPSLVGNWAAFLYMFAGLSSVPNVCYLMGVKPKGHELNIQIENIVPSFDIFLNIQPRI